MPVKKLRKASKLRREYTAKGKKRLEDDAKNRGVTYSDVHRPSVLSVLLLHTNKKEVPENNLRAAFTKLHPLIGNAGEIDQIPVLHNGKNALVAVLKRKPPLPRNKGVTYG